LSRGQSRRSAVRFTAALRCPSSPRRRPGRESDAERGKRRRCALLRDPRPALRPRPRRPEPRLVRPPALQLGCRSRTFAVCFLRGGKTRSPSKSVTRGADSSFSRASPGRTPNSHLRRLQRQPLSGASSTSMPIFLPSMPSAARRRPTGSGGSRGGGRAGSCARRRSSRTPSRSS